MNPSADASLIRHDYAQVNGIRLHYAECGGGDNLIILLHGFPEFWYSWRHQLAVLSERYHAVAPDMRGYNLSDKPPHIEDYRIDLLVNDVIGLIKHFGANSAAIVAHDWGAGIAWILAQQYPQHVSSLIALQVPPAAAWRANITLGQLRRSWYMFFFQLPGIPEWYISRNDFAGLESLFKETVARKGAFTEADIELYKEALRKPGALTAAINYYRANVRLGRFRRSDSGRSIGDGRIRVPTLFIYGEKDFAIVPETVRGLSRYVDAPYTEVRIPDSAHWVQNEAVAEVNSALLDFLESRGTSLQSS